MAVPQINQYQDPQLQRELENIYNQLGSGGGDMLKSVYDTGNIAAELFPLYGTSAPSSTPSYLGQKYINSSNKFIYEATGTSSSADWTLVSPPPGLKMGVTGISTGSGIGANRLNAVQYALPSGTIIQKILSHIGNTTGPGNIKFGIYTDNANAPDALLATSGEYTVAAAADYRELVAALTSPIKLAEGTYWLAFLSDTDLTFGYYITSTQKAVYKNSVTYAGGLPSSFGTPTGTQVAFSLAGF